MSDPHDRPESDTSLWLEYVSVRPDDIDLDDANDSPEVPKSDAEESQGVIVVDQPQ